MGKLSWRRPRLISREEETIRYQLARGEINRTEFDRSMKRLEQEGKLRRRR